MTKKKITQSELDMVARLNAERFSADDLLEISDKVHEIPEEQRGWKEECFF